MTDPFGPRLDRFARRHPALMIAFTILAAVATTAILLLYSQDQTILYKAF